VTRIQIHALAGFLLAFLLVLGVALWGSKAPSAFELAAIPILGALVGALVGLGEWVGQIATLDAVRAIKRGDVDHDDVDEG
jgi:hypothetical protein